MNNNPHEHEIGMAEALERFEAPPIRVPNWILHIFFATCGVAAVSVACERPALGLVIFLCPLITLWLDVTDGWQERPVTVRRVHGFRSRGR